MSSCSKKSDPAPAVPGASLQTGRYTPDSLVVGNSLIKGTVAVTQSELYYTNVGMVQFDQAWEAKSCSSVSALMVRVISDRLAR